MNDDTTDARLREEARETYHRPPDRIPREAIWASIEARLDAERRDVETPVIPLPVEGEGRSRSRSPSRPWLRGALAAAAILVVGVALGRLSAPRPDGISPGPGPGVVAATSPDRGPSTGSAPSPALRVATREHLDRSGSLLAVLRADARVAGGAPETREWARGLLAETRMLLDAPLEDAAARQLLEDLELILAQIVVLDPSERGPDRARAEMELILEGVEERDLMTRLHAAPDGPGRRTD